MTAKQVGRHAAPWARRWARFGYATKGVVYIIIGMLAAQAALRLGGRTTDSSGALLEVVRQPFGRALLAVIAVGLAGHALWRLGQAIFDLEDKGRGPRGLGKRLGYGLSGLAYGSLALTALQLVLGMSTRADGEASQIWVARLLGVPFGRWLVALVGVAAIGLAVNAAVVALWGLFKKKLKEYEMTGRDRRLASVLARVGLSARAVVLVALGWLFIQAAWYGSSSRAGDSGDALASLSASRYGPWLLGGVALGVICYGAYGLVQARYRKIELP